MVSSLVAHIVYKFAISFEFSLVIWLLFFTFLILDTRDLWLQFSNKYLINFLLIVINCVMPKNACTQAAIGFFTAKYKILQLYPNGYSHFYCKIQNSTIVLKRLFVFHREIQNSTVALKLSFVLWLRNTNFLKLLGKGHLRFDNKSKNLKLHINCHSFFHHEIKNLKLCSNGRLLVN